VIGGGCLLELWMGGPVFLDCLLLSGHFIVHWICSAPAAEEDATLFTFLTFIGVEVRTCLPSTLLCSLFHPSSLHSIEYVTWMDCALSSLSGSARQAWSHAKFVRVDPSHGI